MKAQLTIISLFFSIAILSQSTDTTNNFDFVVCEVSEPAIYPGGPAALRKLFSDSAIYPDAAYMEGVGGKVTVRFCIATCFLCKTEHKPQLYFMPSKQIIADEYHNHINLCLSNHY